MIEDRIVLIREQLRNRRKLLKLSQREVALRAGWRAGAQRWVCDLELGDVDPGVAVLLRWADALGCDVVIVERENGNTGET